MPASEPVRWGRKRVLPSCPNPLFLQWLTELRDEAKEKQLKTQFTFQKAINSLTKYPLPLRNAREAKILQNFGDGICKILDDRLQRYYREEGPNAPIHSLPAGAPPAGGADNNRLEASRAVRTRRRTRRRTIKKTVGTPQLDVFLLQTKAAGDEEEGGGRGGGVRRRKREYVPQRRSGGFAVLLALYRHSQLPGNKGFMLKMELQSEAQRLCDRSFTAPDPGSRSTAWSSVRTLIHKNLVLKTHSPARFSLTDEGRVLAERLESAEREVKNVPEEEEEEEVVDLTGSGDEDEEARVTRPRTDGDDDDDDEVRLSEKHQTKSRKPERLLPGTYDIVLCVDVIETTGGSHHRKQELVKELERNGVRFVVRKLNVGDFLWVAREKVSPVAGELRAPAGRELVLDFIVERKRMDDLCGSIIDGRFREQKFRLKRCGLRRPIYLVEGGGASASHLSLPEATLQQAIVNTQVVDGFFVKRVQDVRESAAYLTIMTRYLTSLYQNRVLTRRSRELEGDAAGEEQEGGAPSCSLMSFEEFNHGAVKNKCQTVREVFARQLMQISGLSGDKAAAVLEHYSTPDSLLAAYGRCSSEAEKEKLLSCIRYGKLKRNVGPALSRTVYQLYCTPGALA